MDNHPIPQDVTGFQFKLIGNMTVKQFGYVACGVILAVILYYLPLKGVFGVFIKIIFIPLIGGSGIAIAFLPIEGRPIDVMAGNLIKALVSPNQYLYHKSAKSLNIPTPVRQVTTHPGAISAQKIQEKEEKLQLLLQSMHTTTTSQLDAKETSFLQSFSPPTVVQQQPPAIQPVAQLQSIQTPPPAPIAPQRAALPTFEQQAAALTQELEKAKKEEATNTTTPDAHQKVLALEQQIQQLYNQRQQLDQELGNLKNQLAQQQPTTATQPPAVAPLLQTTPGIQPVANPQMSTSVRNIPKEMGAKMGLPHVPDIPNVAVGIVKDPRGNVLPNMLVEVKDKDGNPVRAFKTNPLGQFASATPLAAGVYTIELEDPKKQHNFDIIQISANNQIMLPIEITSHDAREALRKELFN
jgi:hypothetical protein